jgi:predicted TPR repeat methyltransferase
MNSRLLQTPPLTSFTPASSTKPKPRPTICSNVPNVHDGWDRLGMVYEARGDNKKAADCYRKVIDFIRAHPYDYDPKFEVVFQKLVNRLDPSAPT